MTDINIALARLWLIEGGYVDDPDDRGGATNFGITEVVARKHGYTGDMKDLTREQAAEIYRIDCWLPIGLDKINSQSIANEMFDTAVNCGAGTAARFLQRSLNRLNNNGKSWAEISVDGVIGSITIGLVNSVLPRYEKNILKCLNGYQFRWYDGICENDPTQEKFMNGWLLRVDFL